MRRAALIGVLGAGVGAAFLAGCGGSGTDSPSSGGITVFAAASLTGAFTELGQEFENQNPGSTVTFSFGPSSGLATQIVNGAPADVFAAASTTNMDQVVRAGAAGAPAGFATNVMEIAVPPDDPAGISTVKDLANGRNKIVLCAPEVPCGATALKVFRNAGVTVRPVSQEVDVKAALAKVQLGEADAGVVYVTDVRAAGGKVKGVEIPADVNASTSYPIATLKNSKNAALARAFTDYVRSPAGLRVLTAAGFEKP
jgi:molybdate transport system substrate-binding protein